MKNLFKLALTLISSLFLVFGICFADDSGTNVQNPVTLIQSTIDALQQQIDAGGSALANNPQKLYGVIKQTVMPYVNIDQMAGLALGPTRWRAATSTQKQEFIDQFGLLLTKTYGNALLTVSNYTITLNPLRSNSWQTQQYVAINGLVTSKTNGKSSNLTYYLERSGNSWQIYDLAIEGVSFLKNYQDQFQSFSSMDALIAKIDQLNNN